MRALLTALTALMLFATHQVHAFDGNIPKALSCEFESSIFTVMERNKIVSETDKADFSYVIAGIDAENGKAQLVGNIGASKLFVVRGGNYALHFMEFTPGGGLNTTSVYDDHSGDHKFFAVASRHVSDLSGGPMVSQYYGFCKGKW